MSDNLLLQTIKTLQPRERQALCDWANCRAFNRREEVARLCDFLNERAGKPGAWSLTQEQLFEAAFPGQPYDYPKLRYTLSYLLDLAHRYMAFTEWENESQEQAYYLAKSLRKRGVDQLFQKEWQTALATLEKNPRRDARFHYLRYQLLQEQMEQTTQRERSARINLQPLPDELTLFYIADMLRHACLALSHQATAGQSYRFQLLDAVLTAVEQEEMLLAPATAVYYHAYKALKVEGDEHLTRLKALLMEHSERFSGDERRSLYLLAINVCIRRLNAGQRAYIREAFELYRLVSEQNLLTANGWISGFTYKNIIRLGATLEEHAWTEQFLEQYRPALHARERDNVYRYNLAFLRFQQQDYARAMPLLQQVDLEDTLNNLDARRMLLRIYYELREWDALESLLQSFGAYLRRQKNLGYHRNTNEKLLYFTKKLLEMGQGNKGDKAALKAEIEATADVAERAWLLLQVKI